MQWSKFSLALVFLFTLISQAQAQERFTAIQCLNADFETSVKNEGKFFGLIKNDLHIKKNKCLVEVTFKGILETVWTVDICREPIHMKVKSKGSQNVYKRKKECDKDNKSDYCYFRNELVLNLQDQGLIFANGLKERLSDAHGQVYCSYLLLKKYLDAGNLFSQFDTEIDLYKTDASCDIPKDDSAEDEVEAIKEAPRKESKSDGISQGNVSLDKSVDIYTTPKTNTKEAEKKPRF